MKVTQFETTQNFFMRSYPLQPTGGRMCGVDVINTAETPNDVNFGGFGVAVTAAHAITLI